MEGGASVTVTRHEAESTGAVRTEIGLVQARLLGINVIKYWLLDLNKTYLLTFIPKSTFPKISKFWQFGSTNWARESGCKFEI